MGFSVGKLDDLMAKLKQSDRDWCLVVLLDHENMSPAARQMDQLLDDLDEDSGEAFDFYLPGYDTPTPRQCSVETQHPRRNWRGPFDRWRFRDIYKAIGFESFGQWRFLGDCEVLLFQTKTPRGDGRCYGGMGTFASYNLDDIVKNGRTVNQFIRRMGTWLENFGKKDWVTVKNGVDEIYRELIMPPVIRTPEQELRLREGTSHLVQSHPERGYVFVSYSTKDRAEAENVRGLLESSGVRCWMAPRDIPAGTNYAYVIERAISNCAAFLLLISRNSVQSVWVNKEVLYALGKLQSEGRFHASWLSEPFNLEETGSGMAFALQDVQIDGQNLKDDVSGILLSVLLRGLRSSDQVPISCWVNAVVHHPEWANNPVFASRCPWSQFFNHDWQLILKAASRAGVNLESVIPFEKLTPTGWANLLAKAPSFSTYCEKWAGLTTDNWLVLLRARPEFADKCGIWPEFSSEDWERLLRARPELDRYRKQPDS